VIERVEARSAPGFVGMDHQVESVPARERVAKRQQRAELPRGVHVQQREGRRRRMERAQGQVGENRRILARREQHNRFRASATPSRRI
jgi:hypothetical protein